MQVYSEKSLESYLEVLSSLEENQVKNSESRDKQAHLSWGQDGKRWQPRSLRCCVRGTSFFFYPLKLDTSHLTRSQPQFPERESLFLRDTNRSQSQFHKWFRE